jgi:hypothetical protein
LAHDAQLLFDGGGGMKSKVLEELKEKSGLKRKFEEASCEFIESQIRAAIVEYDTMIDGEQIMIEKDVAIQGKDNPFQDNRENALAAFGVEVK